MSECVSAHAHSHCTPQALSRMDMDGWMQSTPDHYWGNNFSFPLQIQSCNYLYLNIFYLTQFSSKQIDPHHGVSRQSKARLAGWLEESSVYPSHFFHVDCLVYYTDRLSPYIPAHHKGLKALSQEFTLSFTRCRLQ